MKNKNFLKKLTAGILGFIMTLGVGAAGYAASAGETKAAETPAYTIAFSSAGTTVSTAVSVGANYVSSISTANTVAWESSAIKFGSGSYAGSHTVTLSDAGKIKASKIKVYLKQYSSGENFGYVSINGGSGIKISNLATEITGYEVECNSNVNLTSIRVYATAKKNRFYYTKVEVFAGSSCEHDWVDTETISPTCTEPGYTLQTCSKCSETQHAKETAALGHNYGSFVDFDNNQHAKTCSRCGDVVKENHSYGEGVVILEPTYSSVGKKRFTCTGCDHYYDEDIPVLSSEVVVKSSEIVTNSGYTKYENSDAIITFGGNSISVGTNSGNRSSCVLGSTYSKYGAGQVGSNVVASAFVMKKTTANVDKITYTFNGGSNQTSTNVYAIYSSDNSTYSLLELTGDAEQGATISSGTEFEFAKSTGYFGLLFVATNSSGAWRIDNVEMKLHTVPISEDVVVTGVVIKENDAQITIKTITSYEIGSKITFSADVSYDGEEGSNSVTWSSSLPSVATVSNGSVTLLSNGETTITATSMEDEDFSASVTLTLSGGYDEHGTTQSDPLTCAEAAAKTTPTSGKTYYVKGVFIDFYSPSSPSVNDFFISDSTTSSTKYDFYSSTNKGSYSTSDFVAGCTVIMSLSSEMLPIKDYVTTSSFITGATIVSVTKHSLTISTNPSTVYVGDVVALSATCDQSDASNVTFSSTSSTTIGTLDGSSLLAKKANTYNVSATSSCGGTGSKAITINERTALISTSVQKYDDDENFTLPITWNSEPTGTISYKWSSGSTSVATIDQSTGEITILKSGQSIIKCTITVNSVEIKTNECTLDVRSTAPYINLAQQSATKYTGQYFELGLTYGNLVNGLYLYKTNDCISFSLTDNEDGTATVIVNYLNRNSGSARIRFFDASSQPADTSKGYLAEFTANINQSTVEITLDKETATIYSNDDNKKTVQLTATVTATGSYSQNVTWVSDNQSVAIVSSEGLVTAVANGTANITCTSVSDPNVTATCVVTVETYVAPTYEKYEGTIKAGQYIIYGGSNTLGTSVSSNRFTNGEEVEIQDDNTIFDPAESVVFDIQKITGTDSYSIQNVSTGKYLAGNGTKNQGTYVDSLSDVYAYWDIYYVEPTQTQDGKFVFENVGNRDTSEVNYTLRQNDSYGWACYTAGQGNAPELYRLRGPEISVSSSSDTNELVIGSTATLTITRRNGATGTVNWSVESTPTATSDIEQVVTLSSETGDEVVVTGNTHGTAVVTASLTGCESVTQTFTVGRKLIRIEIYDSSSVQTEYKEGDSFDPTGLVIKNVFDNGDKEVTTDWDYDLKGSLLNSNTKVTISSTIDSSLTCELPITVAKNFNFDTQSQISLVDYKYEPSTHVDPITVTQNILSYFGENIPGSGDKVTSINLESGVTATASEAGNNGKVYSNGTEWRFYQADSGTLTLTAPEGKTISSFKLTYKVSDSGIPLYNGETFASGDSVSVNKEENCVISIGSTSGTKGKVSITDIEVVLSGIDIPAEVTILRSASLRSYVHISKDTFEEAFENPSDWEFGFMICETRDLKDGMSFESSAAALDSDATPSQVALNAITTSKAKVNIYSGDELPLYDNSYYEFGLNLKLNTSQFNIDFTVVWFAHNTKTGEYVFATALSSSIYDEAILTDTSTLDEGQKAVIDYIVERYGKA